VTQPTAAMRRAMADADVGDDDHGEDPTVRLLEEETAACLGKAAALYVPSGCMGNEIAIALQVKRGDAILLDPRSHVATVEANAVTALLGRRFHFRKGDRGRLDPVDVAAALTVGGSGDRIGLVAMENTHNGGSGAVYPLAQLQAVAAASHARGIPVHLDGARLWNASAATGISTAEYAAPADSVMVCFSKGLGAPVGSALAGTRAFIEEGRGVRKMFGGGMRQAGIIAAGALHGLRHHRVRLAEDHARARRLASALALTSGLAIDPGDIETNVVIVALDRHPERLDAFIAAAKAAGVLVDPFGAPGEFRALTHLDVDDRGIERAIDAFRKAAALVLGE